MSQYVHIEVELPTELEQFQLPIGVQQRLQELLGRQDCGDRLTTAKRQEAEGLVTIG